METLFRSSKLALIYYFIIVDVATLYDNVGHLLALHSGLIQYRYITPHVFSSIPAGCRMFSPTRTLTACKLLLPFLICLHPTRVIAIYTKTTHLSSLGHGGCIIDVATL